MVVSVKSAADPSERCAVNVPPLSDPPTCTTNVRGVVSAVAVNMKPCPTPPIDAAFVLFEPLAAGAPSLQDIARGSLVPVETVPLPNVV